MRLNYYKNKWSSSQVKVQMDYCIFQSCLANERISKFFWRLIAAIFFLQFSFASIHLPVSYYVLWQMLFVYETLKKYGIWKQIRVSIVITTMVHSHLKYSIFVIIFALFPFLHFPFLHTYFEINPPWCSFLFSSAHDDVVTFAAIFFFAFASISLLNFIFLPVFTYVFFFIKQSYWRPKTELNWTEPIYNTVTK